MSTTSRTYFTIDFLTKSIVGTKTSFDRASKGSGRIYEELTEKMAAHPDFKMVIKEQKAVSKTSKRTYEGLNFVFMKDYIAMQENAELLMKKYEAVKAKAKESGIPVYPTVKSWFLMTFSSEDAPFNMAEAKKAINKHRNQIAENSVEESVEQEKAVVLPAIPETMAAVS